jgi:regulatory protein
MVENALFKTALNRAMRLCSHSELCINDIRSKLTSWGVSENDIEKIIKILVADKFINDERFTQAFVKDKFNINKWGKIKIAAHLKTKNISPDFIRTAMDDIDNDLYKKTLTELISDHRRLVKAKNQYDLKAKLLRYGLSRGFESNLLYDLLNDLSTTSPNGAL